MNVQAGTELLFLGGSEVRLCKRDRVKRDSILHCLSKRLVRQSGSNGLFGSGGFSLGFLCREFFKLWRGCVDG